MPAGREQYERQTEERRRLRRAHRAAAQRARRRRQALGVGAGVVVLVLIAAIVLLVVTGASKSGVVASKVPGAVSTFQPGNVCTYTPDPATKGASFRGFPPDRRATGQHTLTIVLTQGTVVIKLDPRAPCTVNSFQFLASRGFFTGTSCHRLTTSGIYVLQCGDPTGTGSGGPGYTIPDENLTGATYPAGTLAMANTGSVHTGGSQFFLVYKNTQLPPTYTPWGTVVSGLGVLNKIAAAGVQGGGTDGPPADHVKILSFTIR